MAVSKNLEIHFTAFKSYSTPKVAINIEIYWERAYRIVSGLFDNVMRRLSTINLLYSTQSIGCSAQN